MPRTLLLFDIDGTLIRRSGAARVAFSAVLRERFGVSADLTMLQSAGKTDLQIMSEILDRYGIGSEQVDWAAMLASYREQFAEAIRSDPGEVCPGVRQFLSALAARSEIVLALGTGNLEQIAQMKLVAHGLAGYFETGGFAEDGLGRPAVIAAGIARAAARYRERFRAIVVVGDTPEDVEGALANLAYSLCPATGPFDEGELRRAGATLVFPDLSRTEEIIRALSALPPSADSSMT